MTRIRKSDADYWLGAIGVFILLSLAAFLFWSAVVMAIIGIFK